MKKNAFKPFFKFILPLALVAALLIGGSGSAYAQSTGDIQVALAHRRAAARQVSAVLRDTGGDADDSEINSYEDISASDMPAYDSEPYAIIHDNEPFFEEDEITTEVFEDYSNLDSLGRCGEAYANICQELMPTEERESISEVKPSGWHNNPYGFIDGGYLYNRCHLIAFELAGENANEKNLITGTRYFNVTGMLPFENMVADYVKETDNHVLYRVTPLFEGKDLVADGVLMEAYSVEDEGDGVEFCVFVYNVEPGVEIDYATGNNWADGTIEEPEESAGLTTTAVSSIEEAVSGNSDEQGTFVLNTSSMKFHKPTCSGAATMSDKNRKDYTGSREQLIREGYTPCGSCNP